MIGDSFDNVENVHKGAGKAVRGSKVGYELQTAKQVVIFPCGHLFSRQYVAGSYCIFCSDAESLRCKFLNFLLKLRSIYFG